MKKCYVLYLFLLPAFLMIAVFCYAPMYGVLMAFQNYSPSKGITGSSWVGLKWFRTFFNMPRFWQIVKNTLTISLYSLIAGFPIPVILALMINSVRNTRFQKVTQTITYMPHFISVVVLVGILNLFFNQGNGLINVFLDKMGFEKFGFLTSSAAFPSMYVWSGVWQNAGWNSIIYIAALAAIDPQLHEAAQIDGASRLQRILHINLPGILPTAIIMFILDVGQVMNMGFEKVFLMQNDLNLSVSEVISTYVFNIGVQSGQFSFGSAVGLFNTVINFAFLMIANMVSKKAADISLM